VIRLLAYLWAAPNSLLGLLLAVSALGRGSIRLHAGSIEAAGGGLAWVLGSWADAITLGHVILARDADRLAHWREHERRHVRQYEWLGPLFLPAYFGLALYTQLRGRHPYRDHPLERAAGL
jgi:hypothetical protein